MARLSQTVARCLVSTSVLVAVTAIVTGTPLVETGKHWASLLADCFVVRTTSIISSVSELPPYIFYTTALVGCAALYQLYVRLCGPLDIAYNLEDVGYMSDGRRPKKDIANAVAKRKLVGEVPPVYPNGWFAVIESSALQIGTSRNVLALGLNLAIFRDDQGEAHILDAVCPHFGANLGVGGRVVGDCIECPFHGWQFRGHDGKCTKIPATDKIPELARVKSWPCMEVNGSVYLWYHAEGSEPTWSVPVVKEIQNGSWTYRGRLEHYVNTHIEDFQGNAGDQAHLALIHGPATMAGSDLTKVWNKPYNVAVHRWTQEWLPQPAPDEHMVLVKFKQVMEVLGRRIAPMDVDIHISEIGPSIAYIRFYWLFGTLAYVCTNTLPVEPLLQKVVQTFYFPWMIPTFLANIFMKGFAIQFQRDITIWNNKTFLVKPVLTKSPEDAVLVRNKRWFSQFYSEHSPRLAFQKDTLEW